MKFNTKNTEEKAKKIKAILFDIDGVLTDGGIIYDDIGCEYKRYNVKDGQIISHLKRLGFVVGAITGRESDVVKNRCIELKLDFHKHGVKDKLIEYINFKKEYTLADEQIAYIGDDIIDLSILIRCGLSVTPNDARVYIKENVDIVTDSKGGEGVFRDIADYILESQDLLNQLINESKKVDIDE
ncbi:HAD hydrolase family protein [bacterium]|jgi:3-deoxy-D-manno-octulosonate 8-phosphate phosphatase (KDO 8-P phosphatase)|nr:HAD hydrolase family protein [bacterium]